jgi:hypothetical protein
MSEVSVDEIPKHLKLRFDEENKMNQKLYEDQIYLSECYSVHMVSFDIIRTWEENGIMQIPDDVYLEEKFNNNDSQRLMLKFEKKSKIIDLIAKIRRKRQISSVKEVNLYRLTYNKRDRLYLFNLVTPDEYNTDIFGGNTKLKHAIFYICSNQNPMKPLIARYSPDERRALKSRCEDLI